MLKYFVSFTDKNSCVHSIDMLYIEYFSNANETYMLKILRDFHFTHPDLPYLEVLDNAMTHKYDFYRNMVKISGISVYFGRYRDYDKITKEFHTWPIFQIRFNPNKYGNEEWFKQLFEMLSECAMDSFLRKYDYAIDVPLAPDMVRLFNSRKEKGLFKGTEYYGQSGRHNYLKIYDKQKDVLKKQKMEIPSTTRVEYTFFANHPRVFEDVCILSSSAVDTDLSSLTDTQRAIVEMKLLLDKNNISYELNLGRRVNEKLKRYIHGRYVPLEYGCLDSLLERVKALYGCTALKSIVPTGDLTSDDSIFCSSEVDNPFL